MAVVAVTVPSVGESISEGTLARWLKPDGAMVQAGEPLFELETDKASTNVPAPVTGALKIEVGEGQTVAVGATVAAIDPDGKPAAAPSAEATRPAASPGPTDSGGPPPARPSAAVSVAEGTKPADGADGASRPLSPAVRRLVSQEGVDVARVPATGPGGRVTKGDVLAFLESPPSKAAPGPAPRAPAEGAGAATGEPAPATGPRDTRKRMSGLRQRIAQRLVEVQQTAAILTTFNEADMTRVIDIRARYKDAFQQKHGVGLGFMSFFIKASIEALKAFPSVNASIDGNEIVYHHYVDVGVAVSTDRGLMVPVVKGADRLSFAAIEQAIAGYATKARDGTISVDDLQGGTFTITNGGTFGSLMSTPILNPPQSAILGMHAIKKRAVVVDDQVVARPMMYLALSYDHRLIDGREAVSFLVKVKDCVENPERMMFDL
jgi:2-oxoglutarate dehydrogenase E2 component (dihydrolipoamide succinyltransferase)